MIQPKKKQLPNEVVTSSRKYFEKASSQSLFQLRQQKGIQNNSRKKYTLTVQVWGRGKAYIGLNSSFLFSMTILYD